VRRTLANGSNLVADKSQASIAELKAQWWQGELPNYLQWSVDVGAIETTYTNSTTANTLSRATGVKNAGVTYASTVGAAIQMYETTTAAARAQYLSSVMSSGETAAEAKLKAGRDKEIALANADLQKQLTGNETAYATAVNKANSAYDTATTSADAVLKSAKQTALSQLNSALAQSSKDKDTAIAGAERTYDQLVAALDAQYGSASSNGDTGIEGARRQAAISTRDAQYYASRDTSWAGTLSGSATVGNTPWTLKAIASANAQAAYSTNRARAQAAYDAALLSAIDNWQTSNRTSTLSLLLAEGQSREAYNKATATVYANWEMGVGNLLGDKPAGIDWSALGYTGAEQPSGSVSSRKETGRYVQLAAWQDNKEGQAKNDKPAENGLPPRPSTVSVSLDDSIMKGDFDFTPDEFKEFKRQLEIGMIKLTDVPLMLDGMDRDLIKFIYENPEVYKELTRKYGFEYQHKLNALFKKNEVIVGYRGYFDPEYNIEAGRVYLDNSRYTFWTATATTQADRLKDLIDRVGKIQGNDEVRSPILSAGDVASWFDPNRSVNDNLPYVEEEINKFVKTLAWELAGEVIQEATGAKIAAAGGSAAVKVGTEAVAAASNTLAAFLQWRKYKRLGNLADVAPKGKYRGGLHGSTKGPVGDGLDSHHMPAKSVNGLHPDKGPAIQMDPADHAQTASHGTQPGSDIYRLRQQRLIKQGKFGEAIQMDIDNVRELFGNKYDEAIREMIEQLEPWMKKGISG